MEKKNSNISHKSSAEKTKKALEIPQPKHNKIRKFAEPIMALIGVMGQSLFYLQAYKIYTSGKAGDISRLGFSFALFSLLCWFTYGLIIRNKVLIFVNAFAAVGASLTLLSIFLVS